MTAWVLVIVPVLASMALSGILVFPKLAASAWESASHFVAAMPEQAGDGQILPLLGSIVRVVGLALPVARRDAAGAAARTLHRSEGVAGGAPARPRRQARSDRGAAAALAGAAHMGVVALRPVPARARERRRDAGERRPRRVSAPKSVARPAPQWPRSRCRPAGTWPSR